MDHPLIRLLHKPNASGQLVAWAMELSQFTLEYLSRTIIKGQALVDFMVEYSFSEPDLQAQSGAKISMIVDAQPVQSS